eukprot:2590130-Prymnesium_polylepis.1
MMIIKQPSLQYMGAGASSALAAASLPDRIGKEQAKSLAGDAFDEAAFVAAAGEDESVDREAFLKAVERAKPASIASRCAASSAEFTRRLEEAIAAEASRDDAAKQAADAFWAKQDASAFWVVPMGDGSAFARCCGLLAAVERSRAAGKTPLLVDNSEDRVIDTLYSYQQTQVLEAKKLL